MLLSYWASVITPNRCGSPSDETESAPSTPRGYKYTLFVPPRDAHEALWGGEVSGIEGALSTFGADEVSPSQRYRHRHRIALYTPLPPWELELTVRHIQIPPSHPT